MTITAALMLLAQHPEEAAKLRAELAPRVPAAKDEEVWHKDVVNLPHLDGIIWEVLRLYPAVPTSPPRLSPPEGITIAGTYIPGDTELYCPGYVLGRSKYSCPTPTLRQLTTFRRGVDLPPGRSLHPRALVQVSRAGQGQECVGSVLDRPVQLHRQAAGVAECAPHPCETCDAIRYQLCAELDTE